MTSIAAFATCYTLVTTVWAACLTLLRVPVADDFDLESEEKIFDVVLLMDSLYSW